MFVYKGTKAQFLLKKLACIARAVEVSNNGHVMVKGYDEFSEWLGELREEVVVSDLIDVIH